MWYAIVSIDVAGSLRRRLAVRALHDARLERLASAGRLLLAGSCPAGESEFGAGRAGFEGGLIVARFANWKAARDWSDADPFWEAGVYASVSVMPFCPLQPLLGLQETKLATR